MLSRAALLWLCLWLCPALLFGAQEWILIRTTDGSQLEGQADLANITLVTDGKTVKFRPAEILSIHSGAPASEKENERITAALLAVQGKERPERDRAVDEMTAIGVPALTPLLKTLKDTDQHEPRPLYRLFERIMPSDADGVDRSLSLIRLQNGSPVRGALPEGAIEIRKSSGEKVSVPWPTIRSVAIRKKSIQRAMSVHSLRHCNQIEYLDTGVVTTQGSKLNVNAHGFVRLSWNEDGWASDPDGLKKPGSPSYKTNLVGGHPFGALIGRVGSDGEVFFLGKQAAKTNLPAGRVKLAVNDNAHWQNNVGTYSVTMTVTDAYDLGNPQ